jgi:hypothetical protein
MGGKQLRKVMERRGEPYSGGTEHGAPAARLDHGHVAGPVDTARNTYATVETDKICAAAEERMLAVVDDFANARMKIGACTPAQVAAALDQLHAQTSLCQSACCAHARHATAYYRDCFPRIL